MWSLVRPVARERWRAVPGAVLERAVRGWVAGSDLAGSRGYRLPCMYRTCLSSCKSCERDFPD